MTERVLYGPDDLDRIAALWAEGLPVAEIGHRLGIPKNSICRMAFTARKRGDERFPMRERVGPPPRALPTPPRRWPPTICELKENECRYPLTSGLSAEHRFCGGRRQVGSPYCAEHHRICNQLQLRLTASGRRVALVARGVDD